MLIGERPGSSVASFSHLIGKSKRKMESSVLPSKLNPTRESLGYFKLCKHILCSIGGLTKHSILNTQ